MSYLAYELLPYCHAMQSEGSYGSATVLVRQQRVTLPTIRQQWVLGSVTKNLLSMTVLLTPALVRRELQRPPDSRFHRAREIEMLYRLGVTGCGSRVALSEMLRGIAERCFELPSCSLRKFFGRARIGPTSRYAVTAVELCRLRAWPEVGGG